MILNSEDSEDSVDSEDSEDIEMGILQCWFTD